MPDKETFGEWYEKHLKEMADGYERAADSRCQTIQEIEQCQPTIINASPVEEPMKSSTA